MAIEEEAFKKHDSLVSVTIPEGVTNIGDDAFFECKNLVSVIIPESVISIEAGAFRSCSSLTIISIPNGVTSIGSHAFASCYSLSTISIPESVTSIEKGAFLVSGISQIEVNIGNPIYTSIDGVLVDKTKQMLHTYPSGRDMEHIGNLHAFTNESNSEYYEIPEGIVTIGSLAFYGCRNLTSISIPEGVTYIASLAFGDCGSVFAPTTISIPKSVEFIGDGAFSAFDRGREQQNYIVVGGSYAHQYAIENGYNFSLDLS